MNQLTPYSSICVSPGVAACDLENEVALLNIETGLYYGLDAVGARVWSLIQAPTALGAVQAVLLEEYDVNPEVCEAELFALVSQLAEHNLIQILEEPAADAL